MNNASTTSIATDIDRRIDELRGFLEEYCGDDEEGQRLVSVLAVASDNLLDHLKEKGALGRALGRCADCFKPDHEDGLSDGRCTECAIRGGY